MNFHSKRQIVIVSFSVCLSCFVGFFFLIIFRRKIFNISNNSDTVTVFEKNQTVAVKFKTFRQSDISPDNDFAVFKPLGKKAYFVSVRHFCTGIITDKIHLWD